MLPFLYLKIITGQQEKQINVIQTSNTEENHNIVEQQNLFAYKNENFNSSTKTSFFVNTSLKEANLNIQNDEYESIPLLSEEGLEDIIDENSKKYQERIPEKRKVLKDKNLRYDNMNLKKSVVSSEIKKKPIKITYTQSDNVFSPDNGNKSFKKDSNVEQDKIENKQPLYSSFAYFPPDKYRFDYSSSSSENNFPEFNYSGSSTESSFSVYNSSEFNSSVYNSSEFNSSVYNSFESGSSEFNSFESSSSKLDSSKHDSSKLDSSKLNSSKLDSSNLNSSKLDSSKLNSSKLNSSKLNSSKLDSSKLNSSKLDSSKLNSSKLDSSKLNSSKLNSSKLDSSKLNSSKLNSSKLNSSKLNSSNLNSSKLNSSNLNSSKLDSSKDHLLKNENNTDLSKCKPTITKVEPEHAQILTKTEEKEKFVQQQSYQLKTEISEERLKKLSNILENSISKGRHSIHSTKKPRPLLKNLSLINKNEYQPMEASTFFEDALPHLIEQNENNPLSNVKSFEKKEIESSKLVDKKEMESKKTLCDNPELNKKSNQDVTTYKKGEF